MRRERPGAGTAFIDVRVVPRAGRSGVAGIVDGVVRVTLAAAPVDGAANTELIAVLSRAMGLPKGRIEIVSGLTSRSKRVRIAGLDQAAILAALGGAR